MSIDFNIKMILRNIYFSLLHFTKLLGCDRLVIKKLAFYHREFNKQLFSASSIIYQSNMYLALFYILEVQKWMRQESTYPHNYYILGWSDSKQL